AQEDESYALSYGMLAVSFFFSSRRRHTRFSRDWSSDVCSSDLASAGVGGLERLDVMHHQADAGPGLDPGRPGAQAIGGRHATARAALDPRAARDEGLQAARQALGAQSGYGMHGRKSAGGAKGARSLPDGHA